MTDAGRSDLRQWLIGITVVLLCTLLLFGLTGAHDYIPRLRASASSPDGSLRVMVYQQRLTPRPLFPRMGAIAKVYDGAGTLVYERQIYSDDDNDDTVGNAYTQIAFEGDEIRIGPGAYRHDSYAIIRKSELWNLRN